MAQKSNKAQHRTATARPDHFFRRARSVLTFRAARVLKRSAKSETIHTLSDFGLYRQPAGNSGFEIERKRLARS